MNEDGKKGLLGCIAALVALAVLLFVLVPGVVAAFSFTKTDGGHSAVVRNGGPFDNNSIRQTLNPSSSLEYTGMYSDVHLYPAQGRYYDIVPNGADQPGVNAYRTPTKDGVDVGLTARLNFAMNTDPNALKAFDDRYGTRKFAKVGEEGTALAPWEGDEGFATFLDTMIKPIIEETLRQQVGTVDCEQLQASCALVKNNTGPVAANTANAQTIQKIQTDVNAALGKNINDRLGGNFLSGIQFSLTGVDLPQQIRERIEAAQAEFAGASAAQARLNTAKTDADANAERQRGYLACSACAQIDVLKAQGEAWSRMPPQTVWAPGSNTTVPLR